MMNYGMRYYTIMSVNAVCGVVFICLVCFRLWMRWQPVLALSVHLILSSVSVCVDSVVRSSMV